jgi:hypothetical protein
MVRGADARPAARGSVLAVVATGGVCGLPQVAGNTWAFLQWVTGLARLGVDTYWVDHQSRLDPRRRAVDGRAVPHIDCHSVDYARARFHDMAETYGFADRYCILYGAEATALGMPASELGELAAEADMLLNMAGPLPASSPLLQIRRRAYIDLDPGFTQIWAHQLELRLDRFDSFFTVGQNVGKPEFTIPTLGIEWQPILPPVVLDLWPARIDASCERLSTIGDWHGSQFARFNGDDYGGKRDEFLRFLDVAERSGRPIEPALCMFQDDYEDVGLLMRKRWCLRDPYLYAGDLDSYREFIQTSRGEFSVAKNGYVKSRSGWVSDRTACYLASGKPAVVQWTGIEGRVPTGLGLLTFETLDDACEALETVDHDYLEHCAAARRLAETHFDSRLVLGSLLDRIAA